MSENMKKIMKKKLTRAAAERKAIAILREAMNDPDLRYSIEERACIRWCEGLSDSLFDAVLCNFITLDEMSEHDNEGKIIKKPRTDWQEELNKIALMERDRN